MSAETLYYLQQLGITPWVKNTSFWPKQALVILKDAALSAAANGLLQAILGFLEKEARPFIVLDDAQAIDPDSLVLDFRSQKGELSNANQVFPCLDMEALLKNPRLKKELYLTLLNTHATA